MMPALAGAEKNTRIVVVRMNEFQWQYKDDFIEGKDIRMLKLDAIVNGLTQDKEALSRLGESL